MKLKLILITMLLCLLVVLISACGGSGNTAPSVPSAPTGAEPQPAVESPAPTIVQPPEVTSQPAPEQGLNGQQLVETHCTTCHSIDRVKSAKKSADDWAKTVKRMVGKGAELSDPEQQAAIQYLSETYK